jgi:hypothetical protein
MTPDQKFEAEQLAKGLVKYEGRWMTLGEKQRIDREATQRLGVTAYLMSQAFVKDHLKAPASAQFPSYSSDEVVVARLENGHFAVKAYVDSQNGFGAMLRSRYLIEIWPVDGDTWKAKAPFFTEW